MRTSILSVTFAAAVAFPAHAQYSAWLPQPRQLIVTPTYGYQTFDAFWFGQEKVKLAPYDSIQHSALLGLEYGLCPQSAVDVSVGYTWTEARAFDPAGVRKTDDGLADTRFGLRYKLLDEATADYAWAPTLALRVGGIIEGTYQEGQPFSAGDGASGVETSLLFGKAFGQTGFGLYGDIGWRWRNHSVPNDLFGSVGVYQTLAERVTLSFGYRHTQGLDGGDIGEVPFPLTKEISQNIEFGLGIRDNGGRYYQLFAARTLDGRNTGEKWIAGASVSFTFGGK